MSRPPSAAALGRCCHQPCPRAGAGGDRDIDEQGASSRSSLASQWAARTLSGLTRSPSDRFVLHGASLADVLIRGSGYCPSVFALPALFSAPCRHVAGVRTRGSGHQAPRPPLDMFPCTRGYLVVAIGISSARSWCCARTTLGSENRREGTRLASVVHSQSLPHERRIPDSRRIMKCSGPRIHPPTSRSWPRQECPPLCEFFNDAARECRRAFRVF